MCVKPPQNRKRAAFVLLEAMLAVAIFSVGVLALGHAVNNGLTAEIARSESERARMALANRMAEVESGAIVVERDTSEKLEGRFRGMTLKQSRRPLKFKNQDGKELDNLYEVTLSVHWQTGGQEQSQGISFYVLYSS